VTEDEASERYCPATFANPNQSSKCIGSKCMAWRWTDPATEVQYTAEGEPAPGPEWVRDPDKIKTSDARFAVKWDRPRLNRSGYCGLVAAGD
jgi:hypothetical protein